MLRFEFTLVSLYSMHVKSLKHCLILRKSSNIKMTTRFTSVAAHGFATFNSDIIEFYAKQSIHRKHIRATQTFMVRWVWNFLGSSVETHLGVSVSVRQTDRHVGGEPIRGQSSAQHTISRPHHKPTLIDTRLNLAAAGN